jgi:hypothetical protein
VSYTLGIQGPGLSAFGLTYDPTTRTVRGTPTMTGTYTLVWTATVSGGPNSGTTASQSCTLRIGAQPPRWASTTAGYRTFTRGVPILPFQLAAEAVDPAGYSLAYGLSGAPAGLSFDPVTRTVSGTPTTDGAVSVAYTADNGHGGSATYDVVWTVAESSPPIFSGTAANVLGNLTVPLQSAAFPTATDPGGGTVSYTLGIQGPGLSAFGLTYDPTTLAVSGTPTMAGRYTLVWTAMVSGGPNSGQSATQTCLLLIDSQPVWTSTTAGPRTFTNGSTVQPFQLAAEAVSTIGQPITYYVSGLPNGLTYNLATRTVSGTPSTSGTFIVTYEAYDGQPNSFAAYTTVWTVVDAPMGTGQ